MANYKHKQKKDQSDLPELLLDIYSIVRKYSGHDIARMAGKLDQTMDNQTRGRNVR